MLTAIKNDPANKHDLLSAEELKALGFTRIGENVRVSRKAAFHNVTGTLGNHVRIDDFCVLSGNIVLGSYIHIAPFCLLMATGATITMKDCSGLSSHCSLYTASDDYASSTLSNPAVPDEFRKVSKGAITLGIGVIIGSHSVILPKVTIGDGASIGAQCIINKNIPEGSVCVSGKNKLTVTGQRNVNKIKALLARLLDTPHPSVKSGRGRNSP